MHVLSTRRAFVLAGTGALAAPAALAQQSHDHNALNSTEKEKQAFPFLSVKMFVEIDSDDTKGVVSLVRVFVPPNSGPPPHVHSREDEIHTVLRGILHDARAKTASQAFQAFYDLAGLIREAEREWRKMDCLLLPTAGTTYTIDEMLAEIEQLPIEELNDGFSGRDHDQALYGKR